MIRRVTDFSPRQLVSRNVVDFWLLTRGSMVRSHRGPPIPTNNGVRVPIVTQCIRRQGDRPRRPLRAVHRQESRLGHRTVPQGVAAGCTHWLVEVQRERDASSPRGTTASRSRQRRLLLPDTCAPIRLSPSLSRIPERLHRYRLWPASARGRGRAARPTTNRRPVREGHHEEQRWRPVSTSSSTSWFS